MKLGILTVPFSSMSLEETLKYLDKLDIHTVELGTGCYTNDCHCRLKELLADPKKTDEMKRILDKLGDMRVAGYDGTISIEHEDALMSVKEGVEKAVRFLKNIIIEEKPGEVWWA